MTCIACCQRMREYPAKSMNAFGSGFRVFGLGKMNECLAGLIRLTDTHNNTISQSKGPIVCHNSMIVACIERIRFLRQSTRGDNQLISATA